MAATFGKRFTARWMATAAAALMAAASITPTGALASDTETEVVVFKDQAKVFRISRPASTIIVGNPALLAATVQDLQTIVLTGKEFGTTNMIVLDDAGQPILDEVVVVSQNEASLVRVYAGSQVTTLSCAVRACQEAKTDE